MDSQADVITVTAGVYSGRRNPEFVLSGADASALAERARAARGHGPSNPPPPPKLGFYYGFKIHAPKKLAAEFGIPENFTVFSGVLTEHDGREQRHWRDASGVEELLLAVAYREHGELLERVSAPRPGSAKY